MSNEVAPLCPEKITQKLKKSRKLHVVGGAEFSSVDKLIVYAKHIIGRNSHLDSGADFDWLMELLKRHPNWSEKLGCGIKCFHISKSYNGGLHIVLTRVDGSGDTISWKKACSGRDWTPRHAKNWAYRVEIEPQIKEFRTKTFHIRSCEMCQVEFTEPPHVDHTPPFSVLIQEFESKDHGLSFFEFHKLKAKFQLLCRPCNMKKGTSL